MWDFATGRELVTMQGQADEMFGLAWTDGGQHLVARGWKNTLREWDAASGREIQSQAVSDRPFSTALTLAVSPDGRFLAYPDRRWAQVWDRGTNTTFTLLHGHVEFVKAAAFTADGQRLVSVDNKWTVRVWDMATRQQVLALRPPPRDMGTAHQLVMREDGLLAIAGYGGDVRLWDGRE